MSRLRAVSEILSALDSETIDYVHWKSNEHLAAALRGETDLDLLVDPDQRDRFHELVTRLGFIPIEASRERRIEGLESYLGFDEATASLIHLDVHYRVVLGEQLLKNHHLPIERWLLDDEAELEGVPVPRPERELLILYIRSGLKTKTRQIVKAALSGASPYPSNIRSEADWLARQTQESDLSAAALSSGLGVTSEEVIEFRRRALNGEFDWRYVLGQKRTVLRRLERYERMPWYRALSRRAWLRTRSSRLAGRLGLGVPRRHLTSVAPLIAVVGADGSGKTRLTVDLEHWLGSKLQVKHVYMGQPKRGIVFRLLNKPGSMSRNRSGGESEVKRLIGWFDAIKWVWLGVFRRRRVAWSRRQSKRGTVVIFERYPLVEFQEMDVPMDGPRLQPDGPLAAFELAQYRSIGAPDITLALDAPLDTLRGRKEDLSIDEHIPKVEAMASLPDAPGRVRVDVTRPYDQVLLDAKRAVWKAISASR